MDLEQRLRASLVAPDPGPTFTARVLARVGRSASRRSRSLIVVGVIAVTAAAAAMLAWRMSAGWQPAVASQRPSIENDPEVAAPEPDLVVQQPVARMLPESGSEDDAAAAIQAPRIPVASRFSVRVMPLQQQARNSGGRPEAEVFYSAMIDELRKVPGLDLLSPDASVKQGAEVADFVLTITSLANANFQSGGTMARSAENATWVEINAETGQAASRRFRSGEAFAPRTLTQVDGRRTVSPPSQADEVDLNIIPSNLLRRMEVVTGGASATYGSGAVAGVVGLELNSRLTGFNVDVDDEGGANAAPITDASRIWRLQLHAPGAAAEPGCNGGREPVRDECMSPAMRAAAQVDLLRLQVFPPDPDFQRNAIARLPDIDVGRPDGGQAMLMNLLQGLASGGGSRLDAGTIEALARYAARQPAVARQMVWRMLGQSSHPALVAPLLESLRQDPDPQVRIAALSRLEASFSSDPQVRGILESMSRQESDALVRTAARRAYYGPAQWRDEILAAIRDTSRPYEFRFAPLLSSETLLSPTQRANRLAAIGDQQVLHPVIDLFQEQLRAYSSTGFAREVLGLLGNLDEPPVNDLFLRVIRETSALQQETTSQGAAVSMSGPVTTWVFKHRSDPRVLDALSAVNPRYRAMLEIPTAPVAPAAQ